MEAPINQVMHVLKNQPKSRIFELEGKQYKLNLVYSEKRTIDSTIQSYIFQQGDKFFRMIGFVESVDKGAYRELNYDNFKSDFELTEVKHVVDEDGKEHWLANGEYL